jgi:NADP-dependent 3-hydroxy acid dehydrogenase YdfG
MASISEQVVVITGASSGIGRETALAFAKRGASVVLAARNETALKEVAKEIEQLGSRTRIVVTDVAEWAQVEQLARRQSSTSDASIPG